MNTTFDIEEFFHKLDSVDLERNIRSLERSKLAKEYLDLYPFVKRDQVFVDFIGNINGVQYGSPNFIIILYGFGFPEDEIIFSLSQYMNPDGFLKLGEYVDKSTVRNWKSIIYAYNRADKSPVIYARFDRKDMPEIKGRYYPLCIGFQELLTIVFNKNFVEQFQMAYSPDFPTNMP